jgi:single-strand DNA-binding protein
MTNIVIETGRLTADPELRYTTNNIPVTSFSIAVNRRYKAGEESQADFINIVAWRQTAEFISRYFNKGSMILVDGRIQVRDYTDNNGQRRYVTEVVADSVNFAGSKRESGGNSSYGQSNSYGGGYNNAPQAGGQPSYAAPSAYAPSGAGQAPANEFAELNDDDGELPF